VGEGLRSVPVQCHRRCMAASTAPANHSRVYRATRTHVSVSGISRDRSTVKLRKIVKITQRPLVLSTYVSQSLRSARTNRLVVSTFKRSTIDTRAFPVSGPRVWNITSALLLSTFHLRITTYLFRQSFPHLTV